MTIIYHNSLQDDTQVLSSELNKLFSTQELRTEILKETAPEDLTVTEPHQVFFIGLQDIADGKLLSSAVQTSWRYLLIDDQTAIGAVELGYIEGSNELQLLQINNGPFVKATIAGLNFAETLIEVQENDYEMRLLEIPALYVIALWLHGEKDIIIPLSDDNYELKSNTAYSEYEIIAALKKPAKDLLDFSN